MGGYRCGHKIYLSVMLTGDMVQEACELPGFPGTLPRDRVTRVSSRYLCRHRQADCMRNDNYVFRHGKIVCEHLKAMHGVKLYICAGADSAHVVTMIKSVHDGLGK